MIGIGSIVKWIAIAGIVSTIGYGIKSGYEYHLDQIDLAVTKAQLVSNEQARIIATEREQFLRDKAKEERAIIEAELIIQRNRLNDLQRMLLIEHDLDRLLQRKPGLILPRVNTGTENVLRELEELTQ